MRRIISTLFTALFCLCAFAQSSGKPAEIRLVRNATMVIDYAGHKILIDPMFAPKGAFGSWAGKGQKTPMVDLPIPAEKIADGIDLMLVTHTHLDHFDEYAVPVLDKNIHVVAQPEEKQYFKHRDFQNIEAPADTTYWDNIMIVRTKAQHGTGQLLEDMGAASGYVLENSMEPTIYILGDAILTSELIQEIEKYHPDYIVVNSAGAELPKYPGVKLIMGERQVAELINRIPFGKFILVHLDAVDHATTSRQSLKKYLDEVGIPSSRYIIPADGEIVRLNK